MGGVIVILTSSLFAMMADVVSYQAKRLENYWLRDVSYLDQSSWQRAEDYVQSALSYTLSHPDYLQQRGRLSYWQLALGSDTAITDASAGLDYLRAAMEQRPYWPYGWSELALLKARLGQYDKEFNKALTLAKRFGSWEAPVQSNMLGAYFGAWESLSWQQRAEGIEIFLQMLDYNYQSRQSAWQIAGEYGRKPMLCSALEGRLERLKRETRRYCSN